MKNKIHPLARAEEKSAFIRFVHIDKKEHTYSTCVNDLTGDRMSWFDNHAPDVNQPLREIKRMFKNINKKAVKVIEYQGDFKL
jgi:hypothetical protein